MTTQTAGGPEARAQRPEVDAKQAAFLKELAELNLDGLWTWPEVAEPTTPVQPFVWRWNDVRRQLLRAAEFVPPEDIERLALLMMNPGIRGRGVTTQTLGADLQVIRPGDVAEGHRHTFSAIRFVVEGQGAYTVVEGEKFMMARGDLILTPGWTWHEHANEADAPVIWLDGLDTLTRTLNAYFKEWAVGRLPVNVPLQYSELKYRNQLRPLGERAASIYSAQRAYRWKDTYETLTHLASIGEVSPFDDVAAEYLNPLTGGPVLPIMGCVAQVLRPGIHTRAHRHTSSHVYHVYEGQGFSVINGQRFDWAKGDTMALPSWTWHEHANASSSEEAILFSINDVPVMQTLDLFREQAYSDNDGYQAENQ